MTVNWEKFKIVVDSSADMRDMDGLAFASAPLKIITDAREYTDDSTLDVRGMVSELAAYSGRSSSSCPSVGDWLEAFGDAERVFCLTITATLSGSYNAACMAKEEYEEQHPDRCVFVMNTLTAGPEIALIAEFIRERVLSGGEYGAICAEAEAYSHRTELLFMLESMKNLANNGRVSPIVAKIAGVLGIRAVGRASDQGTLEVLDKVRGEKVAVAKIFERMLEMGYQGGKVLIDNCVNLPAAKALQELVRAKFPKAEVEHDSCTGLCSFYAEKGGLMVGFECN